MYYPDYLVHFNKNHSPKNGQFTSGDGDGDNIKDDHHNYSKNKGDLADAHRRKKSIAEVYDRANKKFNTSLTGKYLYERHSVAYKKQLKKEYSKNPTKRAESKKHEAEANEYEVKFEYSKAKRIAKEFIKEYGLKETSKILNFNNFDGSEKDFINKYADMNAEFADRNSY